MKRFIFFASLLGCFILFGSVVTAQTFQISSADQNFVGTPGSTVPFSATFSIEQVSGVTQEMCGFQFQYSHDPSVVSIDPTEFPTTVGEVAALNNGDGPGFMDGQIIGSGFTIGMLFTLDFSETISFGTSKPVLRIDYESVPGAFNGITTDIVMPIVQSNDLGNPIIDNIMSTLLFK